VELTDPEHCYQDIGLFFNCRLLLVQGEHGAVKQECKDEHHTASSAVKLEESVILSPDYLRLGRKRKSDQMKVPPLQQHPQQQQQLQQQPPVPQAGSVDLDSSQVRKKLVS
jgi:hypothetical protein